MRGLRTEKRNFDRFETCRRHMLTAGIGGLSTFEEHFGRLWGHGKEVTDKTDGQLQFMELWERCREEFLDKMNKEIRVLRKKLEN